MGTMDNRVVIVTGGGHGIGRAYCRGLAAEGAKVVVTDIDGPAAERVAGELYKLGSDALALAMDVAQEPDVQHMASATVARFGRIDALINNAAVFISYRNNLPPAFWFTGNRSSQLFASMNASQRLKRARAGSSDDLAFRVNPGTRSSVKLWPMPMAKL